MKLQNFKRQLPAQLAPAAGHYPFQEGAAGVARAPFQPTNELDGVNGRKKISAAKRSARFSPIPHTIMDLSKNDLMSGAFMVNSIK